MKQPPTKKKKLKEYVGPEGQAFAGHDQRSTSSQARKENPATNQVSDPKAKEEPVPKAHQGLAQDAEDRNADPDYRHN